MGKEAGGLREDKQEDVAVGWKQLLLLLLLRQNILYSKAVIVHQTWIIFPQ